MKKQASVLILGLALNVLAGALQAAIAAGQASNPVEDHAVSAFAPIRLHIARSQGHTVTRLNDGRLLVLGGRSDNAATAAAELIDPRSGRVELLSRMVQARQGHTATLLPDGRVLVAGGDLGDGRVLALSAAEIFDPRTRTFQATALPMTLERSHHTATLLKNGKVLIAGGQGVRPAMVTFSAELFDPASGRFERLSTQRMVAPRTYHAATLLDSGQVLIVGGTDWQTLRAPNSAELFDPVDNSFTQLESGLSARNEMPQAIKLSSGHVMVLNSQGTDLFDPVTRSFIPLPGPLKARSYESASALHDGGAVVLGGLSANTVTASVERYDPWRVRFWPAGWLRQERAWGVAALTYSGAVFVIGGVDGADAPIADVAVYRP